MPRSKKPRVSIPIREQDLQRIQRFVINSQNLTSCYKESGVAPQTVHRMLKNKFGTPDNVSGVLTFCKQVEDLMNQSKQAS